MKALLDMLRLKKARLNYPVEKFIIIMMIYQEAFAKANHYLDDADLLSSSLCMDGLARAGISVSNHKNFLNLVMRPRV